MNNDFENDYDKEEINVEKETTLSLKAHRLLHDSCPYGEDPNNYQDYTEDEIKKFPFEIRCCYYITAFNKNLNPKSIEEWATKVGWLHFDQDECFYKCAVRCAINEVSALIKFIKGEIELIKNGEVS